MRALLLFLTQLSAFAQIVCSLGSATASYQPSRDQRPTSDAMQIAGRVNAAEKTVCASNCPEVALVRNTTAPNVALIVNQGQGKLVYAPQFFAVVYSAFGDSGILAVMAHETGHALDDAMGAAWIDKSWRPELRADAWAGCILARSNLTSGEMKAALAALTKFPSPAHPAWKSRVPAIRAGYMNCGGDDKPFR